MTDIHGQFYLPAINRFVIVQPMFESAVHEEITLGYQGRRYELFEFGKHGYEKFGEYDLYKFYTDNRWMNGNSLAGRLSKRDGDLFLQSELSHCPLVPRNSALSGWNSIRN